MYSFPHSGKAFLYIHLLVIQIITQVYYHSNQEYARLFPLDTCNVFISYCTLGVMFVYVTCAYLCLVSTIAQVLENADS